MSYVDKVKQGRYFVWNNMIHMKIAHSGALSEPNAVNTVTGNLVCLHSSTEILPVDIIIRAQATQRINHDS